jgi:hypothetical protein
MIVKETFRQVRAVMALELARVARAPATIGALVVFTTLVALGQWLHWRTVPPRPEDDRLYGYAFLSAVMIGLRFGFSGDRSSGSDMLLIGNLIRPRAFFLGKLGALALVLLTFTAYAITAAGLLSAGDWSYALWYSILFALVVWLFIPATLLAELVMDTRYPGPAVFVAFVVAVTLASVTTGVQPLIEFLGFNTQRLTYASLAPLAWRALVAGGIMAVLYPIWRWRTIGCGGP